MIVSLVEYSLHSFVLLNVTGELKSTKSNLSVLAFLIFQNLTWENVLILELHSQQFTAVISVCIKYDVSIYGLSCIFATDVTLE